MEQKLTKLLRGSSLSYGRGLVTFSNALPSKGGGEPQIPLNLFASLECSGLPSLPRQQVGGTGQSKKVIIMFQSYVLASDW